MSYSEDDIDRMVAQLNEAGEEWEAIAAQMPEVRAVDRAHGRARAVVELDAPRAHNQAAGVSDPYAVLYRVDDAEPATWHPLGWSTASRARLGRDIGPDGVQMTAHSPESAATGIREKLAGLSAMTMTAAVNPDVDDTFVADVHGYLHGDNDPHPRPGV